MRRILVADDNEDLQVLMMLALESAGHVVDVVADGETAWERLRADHYDVAVLDIMMPKMSGLGLTELIRAEARLVALRIVLVSALSTEAQVRRGLAVGADAYLTKPFSLDELRATVDGLRPHCSC